MDDETGVTRAGARAGNGSRRLSSKARSRRALALAASIAATSIAIVAGVTGVASVPTVQGCVEYIDLCEPEGWFAGTLDLGRLEACCPDPGHPYCTPDAGRNSYCCPGPPGDAGSGGGGGGEGDAAADGPIGACPGECSPGPPSGWDAPAIVWIGPEGEAPSCPGVASVLGYEGHADLEAPIACGACQCGPPEGSCHLPATLGAQSAGCGVSGAAQTSFDPPPGWEGGCTMHDAIAAGLACAGGPCVQSLTIAPLGLDESGCAPFAAPAPGPSPPTWGAVARVCRGFPGGPCDVSGDVCGPDLPPGFRRCVFHDGDVSCPGPIHGPYQERHVVHAGLSDTRQCSACACDPPEGSACLGSISIFSDDACSMSLVSSYLIDSSGPACIDLVNGSALGSKAATSPTFVPGACVPSGGEPIGSAEPQSPSTLCCIPLP